MDFVINFIAEVAVLAVFTALFFIVSLGVANLIRIDVSIPSILVTAICSAVLLLVIAGVIKEVRSN